MGSRISPSIAVVMVDGRSVLPTGRIKYEHGKMYQEATVIRHNKQEGFEPGIRNEWFFVDLPVIVISETPKA